MNGIEQQMIDILNAGKDVRSAYALPAVRPGKCPECGGRTWGADKNGVCRSCLENPITGDDLRLMDIPARYRWARLEQPIIPPGWLLESPLISEQHRARALEWADGHGDGPKNALTIAYERDGVSHTGKGKSSLAAAVARHIAIRRKLHVTWVHASELRADHDDPAVPREALRRLLRAPLSVLDGLGKELAGAHDVKGWQPARMSVMMDYAREMYERADGIRITTVDLPGKVLVDVYGADLVRRFGRKDKTTGRTENATIIML